MPKYIREARFGVPKTWKTGSVLGDSKKGIKSYPQPILLLEFDPGGHEICPDILPENVTRFRAFEAKIKTAGYVAPNITVVDFSFQSTMVMEEAFKPTKEKETNAQLTECINLLNDYPRKKLPFPYKTIILDPVTELSEACLRAQAELNPEALSDARKWAGNVGAKVQQVINYITSFPCNVVFIFHSEINTDETTKQVSEQPMVYSKLRDWLGGKFTQYFYQQIVDGKPMLRTKQFELVRGIGCRWPTFTTEKIGPTFNEIYGKEPDVFQ